MDHTLLPCADQLSLVTGRSVGQEVFRARKEPPGWWQLFLPRAGHGTRGALRESCGFYLPHLLVTLLLPP